MTADLETELEERLLRYVAIDTQSDESSATTPSTAIQLDLSRRLEAELTSMGASDVAITGYGAVLATIPATVEHDAPCIGFVAHVDTAPAYHASGVKPRVHRNHDGGPITFPDAPGLVLSPESNPYLATRTGDTIITASGGTLLGADDKAGVAIIMAMARRLLADPSIPHGTIRIAFTPDEEIGRGVDPGLPGDLRADFAYSLDGAERGSLEAESFSADLAVIRVTGVSTHPGTAKGRMVNAVHLAARIIATLPQATMTPEVTEGREGFWHIYEMTGTAAEAEMKIILRDFERDGLAAKGAMLQAVCDAVAATEPRAGITLAITPQYRNMAYWLKDDPRPVRLAENAYRAEGIEPRSVPIRGGTDGSRLTEMGVPCPNLFTGMQDIHGPLEWVSVQDMAAATRVCLRLVQLGADRG